MGIAVTRRKLCIRKVTSWLLFEVVGLTPGVATALERVIPIEVLLKAHSYRLASRVERVRM